MRGIVLVARKQCVNQFLAFIRCGVIHKGAHFIGRWNHADNIEIDAPREGRVVTELSGKPGSICCHLAATKLSTSLFTAIVVSGGPAGFVTSARR